MPEKKKWEGRGEQAKGKVKESVGKVTGKEDLEARGKAEQGKGKIQETLGKAKEKVKQATD
jgi:uncharacterized protein YjbJ (UPF0337 family)